MGSAVTLTAHPCPPLGSLPSRLPRSCLLEATLTPRLNLPSRESGFRGESEACAALSQSPRQPPREAQAPAAALAWGWGACPRGGRCSCSPCSWVGCWRGMQQVVQGLACGLESHEWTRRKPGRCIPGAAPRPTRLAGSLPWPRSSGQPRCAGRSGFAAGIVEGPSGADPALCGEQQGQKGPNPVSRAGGLPPPLTRAGLGSPGRVPRPRLITLGTERPARLLWEKVLPHL